MDAINKEKLLSIKNKIDKKDNNLKPVKDIKDNIEDTSTVVVIEEEDDYDTDKIVTESFKSLNDKIDYLIELYKDEPKIVYSNLKIICTYCDKTDKLVLTFKDKNKSIVIGSKDDFEDIVFNSTRIEQKKDKILILFNKIKEEYSKNQNKGEPVENTN